MPAVGNFNNNDVSFSNEIRTTPPVSGITLDPMYTRKQDLIELAAEVGKALERGEKEGYGTKEISTTEPEDISTEDILATSMDIFEDRSQGFINALKRFLENDDTNDLENFQIKFGMVQRNNDDTGTVDLEVSENGETIGKFTISSNSTQCNGINSGQHGCIKQYKNGIKDYDLVVELADSNVKHFTSRI